jgi:hypothetical protein
MMVPIAGGTPTLLAQGASSFGLAAGGGQVYFSGTIGGKPKLARVPSTGGQVVAIADIDAVNVALVALLDSNVYWADQFSGRIIKVLPSGFSTLVVPAPHSNGVEANLTAFAVDSSGIYWTIDDRVEGGSVHRASLDGSSPLTLAINQSRPNAIALDGNNVYWIDQPSSSGGVGAVMKMRKP